MVDIYHRRYSVADNQTKLYRETVVTANMQLIEALLGLDPKSESFIIEGHKLIKLFVKEIITNVDHSNHTTNNK